MIFKNGMLANWPTPFLKKHNCIIFDIEMGAQTFYSCHYIKQYNSTVLVGMSHVQPQTPPKNHPSHISCKEITKYSIKNGNTFRQLDIEF